MFKLFTKTLSKRYAGLRSSKFQFYSFEPLNTGLTVLPNILRSEWLLYFIFLIFFTVDKKEVAAGHDPEKELKDSGFHDLSRA